MRRRLLSTSLHKSTFYALYEQVQNITQTAITMERVTLEPSNSFTVESITAEPGAGQGVAARGLALQVQDSWQYLFCLKPRPEHNNKNLRQVSSAVLCAVTSEL